MEERPTEFEQIVHRVWEMLARGVADRRHAFHTPTFATIDGVARARPRTVVLRLADAEERALGFHCDQRSAKAEQVRTTGRATWHFYGVDEKTQLVIDTDTALHTDDAFTDERWQATSRDSRVCYERPFAPGTQIEAPYEERAKADDIESGRANFAVVLGIVTSIDYLHLHHAGHLRCRLTWDGGWTGVWLAP